MKARASAQPSKYADKALPTVFWTFHKRERERERVTNLLPAAKIKLYLR